MLCNITGVSSRSHIKDIMALSQVRQNFHSESEAALNRQINLVRSTIMPIFKVSLLRHRTTRC